MTVEYFLVSRQKLHAKGSSGRSQPEGIGVRPGLLAGCTESLEVDHPIWPREHVEFAAISDTPLNRSNLIEERLSHTLGVAIIVISQGPVPPPKFDASQATCSHDGSKTSDGGRRDAGAKL